MSDLRHDDIDLAERASLPPELLAIDDRLTSDGARWRRRAPDGSALPAWTRATLNEESGSRVGRDATRHAPLAQVELDMGDIGPTPHVAPTIRARSTRSAVPSRLRNVLGAAAAIVVVGLIALLLTQGARNRARVTGDQGLADATPQPTATIAPPSTAFLQPNQLPVVSPSDPSVVYKVANSALQRSADGGKTYSSLAFPKTDLSSVDGASVSVSPLDTKHVFLNLSGRKNDQVCPGVGAYPTIAMHGGINAGGYIPCDEQFVSADGGQTWSKAKLPYTGGLGGLNNYRGSYGAYGDAQYTIKANGSRLYAAEGFDNQNGSLVDGPGVRLVASDDGGLTWNLVDQNLVRSNRYLCDVGLGSKAGLIYAVTGDQSCGQMSYPKLSLWLTNNDGQSWTFVRTLPTLAETGVFVGAQNELYLYMPDVNVFGHGANETSDPSHLHVSLDNGATLANAPLTLDGSTTMALSGPLATLADGSIVVAAYGSGSGTPGGIPMALYSWKAGASSWTKLSQPIAAGVAAVVPLPAEAGAGQQTLLVIDDAGNLTRVTATLKG